MLLIGFYIFMRSWGVKHSLHRWGIDVGLLQLLPYPHRCRTHLEEFPRPHLYPPTIAGLVLAFHRRKYLLGFLVWGYSPPYRSTPIISR